MKKMCFKIPIYKVNVTLLQVEDGDKADDVLSERVLKTCSKEDLSRLRDYIDGDFKDGGDTFRCLENRRIFVIFYVMSSEIEKANCYSHEKRHIEDRILEFFSVDDVESAGLLAGFLGEKFYKFEKL